MDNKLNLELCCPLLPETWMVLKLKPHTPHENALNILKQLLFSTAGHDHLVTAQRLCLWEASRKVSGALVSRCFQSSNNSPRARSSSKQRIKNQVTHRSLRKRKTGYSTDINWSARLTYRNTVLWKKKKNSLSFTTVWFWSLGPIQVCLGQVRVNQRGEGAGGGGRKIQKVL